VVINQQGSAGGDEERFYLLIYDSREKIIDVLMIGQSVADCSSFVYEESIISKFLSIEKRITNIELDCLTDEEIKKETFIEYYNLKKDCFYRFFQTNESKN
jgi:hypothetical protein